METPDNVLHMRELRSALQYISVSVKVSVEPVTRVVYPSALKFWLAKLKKVIASDWFVVHKPFNLK